MTDLWDESNLQDIGYQVNAIRRNQERRYIPTPEDYFRQNQRARKWVEKSAAEHWRDFFKSFLWMVAFLFLSIIPLAAVGVMPDGFSGFFGAVWTSWLDIVTFNFPSLASIWMAMVTFFWLVTSFMFYLQDSGAITTPS